MLFLQNFEVDDFSYLLQLINSGEIQVVVIVDKEGVVILFVDMVWNEYIDVIFFLFVNVLCIVVEFKKKSCVIILYWLFISVEVVNEKWVVVEKKKKIEEEK